MTVPFPRKEYENRITNCQNWMKKEQFEAILAYSMGRWSMMAGRECGGNGIYYIGFNYPPHKMQTDGGRFTPYIHTQNIVFIPKTGDPSLLIPGNPEKLDEMKKQVWLDDIRLVTSKNSFIDHSIQLIQEKGLNQTGKIGLGGKQTPIEIPMGDDSTDTGSDFYDSPLVLDTRTAISGVWRYVRIANVSGSTGYWGGLNNRLGLAEVQLFETYTVAAPGGAIPEPAGLGIAGLILVTLKRRRR